MSLRPDIAHREGHIVRDLVLKSEAPGDELWRATTVVRVGIGDALGWSRTVGRIVRTQRRIECRRLCVGRVRIIDLPVLIPNLPWCRSDELRRRRSAESLQ